MQSKLVVNKYCLVYYLSLRILMSITLAETIRIKIRLNFHALI